MECVKQQLSNYQQQLQKACHCLPFPVEQACFFDIETTGLSARVSSLYLLGAAYVKEGCWHLVQWFADDYVSEKEILTEFASFLSGFHTVIHYNGSTFDIPYLEKKYQSYQLGSPFFGKSSLDLFRQLPHKKELFSLPDNKLTTVERFLGFHRNDAYTGKDCIRLYTDFMQKKYFRDPLANVDKQNLLLHNHDDLIGTILCSKLLSYLQINHSEPHYRIEGPELILSAKLADEVPETLTCKKNSVQLTFKKNKLILRIPLFEGTLYHYFKDYKNYYYLPEEDMAVHKSVGAFVDASFRKKATASNCYIKRTGTFLPLPADMKTNEITFQKSRRASQAYLPFTEQTSLSREDCLSYLKAMTL